MISQTGYANVIHFKEYGEFLTYLEFYLEDEVREVSQIGLKVEKFKITEHLDFQLLSNNPDFQLMFIEKVREIFSTKFIPEQIVEFIPVETEPEITVTRRLLSRILSSGSYIATNSRMGPARYVFMPYEYLQLFRKYDLTVKKLNGDEELAGLKIIESPHLSDEIVLGRTSTDKTLYGGIYFFLDEKNERVAMETIGKAAPFYHILKVPNLSKTQNLGIENSFLSERMGIDRLKREFREHKSLVIGFDFDNTIFDYHEKGLELNPVIELLARCSDLGFTMCLYSLTSPSDKIGINSLQNKVRFCNNLEIKVHHVNESPLLHSNQDPSAPYKPFFSILLDDRAGLPSAYTILKTTLDELAL